MIVESLRDLAVPITDLHALKGNPRRGDVKAVAKSLERFGQRKPLVARRSDKVVIAGNHTLLAAIHLGWPEVAVSWVDDDDATSKAYALADNKTSALGTFDAADLEAMIGEVEAVDPELLLAASMEHKPNGGPGDTGEQLGGLEYRVVVLCAGERHQEELLERFTAEGLDCKAVIV
jgi:ParB-like nuclease family protein